MAIVPRLAAMAVAAITAAAVTGCASMGDDMFSQMDRADRSKVAERYPVTAELQRTKINVTGFRGYGPDSTTAYFNALRFVRAYAQEGRGPLYVAKPSHGAHQDVQMVRRVIHATGLSGEQVRYHTRRDGLHAVTLAYDRIAAKGPEDCYDQSPLEERRPQGESGTGFGCATQKNLAKMIADPSDLVVPAPETDRGSDRRAVVYRDYRDTIKKPAP